jgi:steroid delta-isomerase-like uncharacterized protein
MTFGNYMAHLFERLLVKIASEMDPVAMPVVGGDASSENELLIRRWHKIENSRRSADLEAYFTSDYLGHVRGSIRINLAELQWLEQSFATAFSDISFEIDNLFSAGDKVVLRSTTQATHSGEFLGIEASGRIIRLPSIVTYQVRSGRIAESWGEFDSAGIWRQLTRRELPCGK